MHRARGMTLIEMVLAIVIVSIVLAATAPIIGNTFQSYVTTRSALDTTSKARLAVERIAREIRDVNFNVGAGAYQFTTMTPTNATFTKTDGTTVAIIAIGANLNLSYSTLLVAPPPLLTNDLNALSLQYFQEDGTTTTTNPALVRFVEIGVTLNVPNTTGAVHTERTRVALRDKS